MKKYKFLLQLSTLLFSGTMIILLFSYRCKGGSFFNKQKEELVEYDTLYLHNFDPKLEIYKRNMPAFNSSKSAMIYKHPDTIIMDSLVHIVFYDGMVLRAKKKKP